MNWPEIILYSSRTDYNNSNNTYIQEGFEYFNQRHRFGTDKGCYFRNYHNVDGTGGCAETIQGFTNSFLKVSIRLYQQVVYAVGNMLQDILVILKSRCEYCSYFDFKLYDP